MSLNDPHWGRAPEEKEPKENRDDSQADGWNQNAEEQGESRSCEDACQDERRAGDAGRCGRKNRDDRRDERSRNNPDEDIDRLWEDFRDIMSGLFGSGGRRRQNRAPSALKSRDDFSRDDVRCGSRSGREADRDEPNARADDDHAAAEERSSRNDRTFIEIGIPGFRKKRPAGGFGNGAGGGRRSGGQNARRRGVGTGILALCAVLGWAASGFYIVPEGQTGVETTFGRYSNSSMPGFHWHLPAPIQDVQLVDVSSVRTASIGSSGSRSSQDRLREALMLTDDENIVDVQFTVQYRIKSGDGAKDYLFNTRAPDLSVTQAAESAMREVVGRKTMDSVLFESKAEIAEAVKQSMQQMLDRYATGIEVMSVAIQNAQPPQQVQAAFNDAVKAGQDRERSINLGEAYMNAVIPKAQGNAARLKEEAEAYKARATEVAKGDAERFSLIYNEYQKAPQVMRDRLYVDAMRDIYSNVTKVYVDQKSGSNLLYLPLDKIVAGTKSAARDASDSLGGLDALNAADPANAGTTTSTAPSVNSGARTSASTSNASSANYATEDEPRALVRSRMH